MTFKVLLANWWSPSYQVGSIERPLEEKRVMREGRVGGIVVLLILSILIATTVAPVKAEEKYHVTATIQTPGAQYAPWNYGCSVAVNEDIVVVGEYSEEVEGNRRAGKAQIFDLDGNLMVTLQSPTPQGSGSFGLSVAIRGDIILIGEPGATVDGKTWVGKGYIYNSDGSLQATIQSPIPMNSEGFGWTLCFSGDTIVVEDAYADVEDMLKAGMVHLYDSDGNFLETIQSPEPSARAEFGHPVVGFEGIFVVGEHLARVGDTVRAGKAYIFDSGGDLLATLQSPEPQIGAFFGQSIAVSGNIVVVGEYLSEVEGNSQAGRAHIFDAEGNLLASLQSPEPEASAMFGWSVDTNGDLILVGEPNANGESIDEGRVYVFDPEGNLLETLSAPEPTPGTDFGNLVLVEGEIIVVGEYARARSVGRFYIFQQGAADFKSSGLTINPGSVDIGGTVTISVECSNEGSISGSHTVTLKIDGEVEDEKTVTVAPNESTTISFDAPTSEKGTYNVEIDGLTGSYEVKGGIPGFPVESLISGLVVAILILWFRQRTK